MPTPEANPNLTPRLRPVEALPVQMNNQDMVCLRDPEGLAEQPIFLNQALVFLISRMDGEHTLRDIQAEFFRASSQILPMETLENLVAQLDQQHYLASPEFFSYYRGMVEDFQNAPRRPPRHAGTAYEESPEALRAQLQSYFTHPEGPGNISSGDGSKPLKGLIAPHIDFARGGPAYAHAYKVLADHPETDTFVVFGTCHAPMPQRFSVAGKDYETPLGPAIADRDFIAHLSARLGNEYRHEFSHRGEHSIEFQAVWLKYILGNRSFKIIPILVSSFHDIYSEGRTAAEDPEITMVVNALRETIREAPGRICVVAGADLAHVGRQFGDTSGLTTNALREIANADRHFLELVEAGDAEGMFRSIASDNDSRRICGYPPIYMTLRCIEKPEGQLLKYQQWLDAEADSAVTFAALALF